MSHTLLPTRRGPGSGGDGPRVALDADDVREAYRRWAGVYDVAFGGVSAIARRRAVALTNRLPGRTVLEMGVGTGLALRRVTCRRSGSPASICRPKCWRRHSQPRGAVRPAQRQIAARDGCRGDTDFADVPGFDIAVAMFVASVVPSAPRLLAEMRRVDPPRRHHPVRRALRRQGRTALVGRAGDGPGLLRVGLASGLLDGRTAQRRRPGTGRGADAAVRHFYLVRLLNSAPVRRDQTRRSTQRPTAQRRAEKQRRPPP